MIKIICVLKTGGWCNADDVLNLKENLKERVECNYEFVCYSDDESVADVKLEKNYPGWWSKVEIFRETGQCIFFDLDTAIFSNIEGLFAYFDDNQRKIAMLRPFYTRRKRWHRGRTHVYASGVIAWSGDYSYIYREFSPSLRRKYSGDQEYIQSKLMEHGDEIGFINEHVGNILSYRWDCRRKIPANIDVCCFHGNPRPKKVGMPFWGYHKRNQNN